jgi:energy-coupling factor transporter ATP-binding protein EcfA2
MRPYIAVCKIPNFDPTQLPFWDIYEREGTSGTIMAGGTMAGQFTAGLSGGQRKMLLFELIVQRTSNQSDLLIVLDEPFAGVTDDCKPVLWSNTNVLLRCNPHVSFCL